LSAVEEEEMTRRNVVEHAGVAQEDVVGYRRVSRAAWSPAQFVAIAVGLVLVVIGGVALARSRIHADPVTVSARTPIHVTLDQALASNQSRPGDHFDGTVAEPVVVRDKVVVPQGARVEGVVVDAHQSGGLRGRARLQLALEAVELDGKRYEISTTVAHRVGGDHKKRNLAWIGGGGGAGVLIGALAAGGKGALIGGPIGAGAGTAVAYFTGRKDIHLPAETRLTFQLAKPLTVEGRLATLPARI